MDPFEVTRSLSGVRICEKWLAKFSPREIGMTDVGESNENARFGVLEWLAPGVPGTGAGAANTLNSARRSRVSS